MRIASSCAKNSFSDSIIPLDGSSTFWEIAQLEMSDFSSRFGHIKIWKEAAVASFDTAGAFLRLLGK